MYQVHVVNNGFYGV